MGPFGSIVHCQSCRLVRVNLDQGFPNVLACDPKETFDVCPGPKVVKTADRLFSLLFKHLFSEFMEFQIFLSFIQEMT